MPRGGEDYNYNGAMVRNYDSHDAVRRGGLQENYNYNGAVWSELHLP